jgi:hypothetical protein
VNLWLLVGVQLRRYRRRSWLIVKIIWHRRLLRYFKKYLMSIHWTEKWVRKIVLSLLRDVQVILVHMKIHKYRERLNNTIRIRMDFCWFRILLSFILKQREIKNLLYGKIYICWVIEMIYYVVIEYLCQIYRVIYYRVV